MKPDDPTAGTAGPGPENLADLRLTQTQKEILEALCRPQADGSRWATPATNQEIASKVYLSVDAVKAHLRVLYRKFGVEPLPHNQKRARLVELVFEGNVLELPATEESPSTETPVPPSPGPDPTDPAPSGPGQRSLMIAGGIAGIAALIALLFATGVIGGSDSDAGDEPTPLGEYRAEVNRFCGFAIPFEPPSPTLPVDVRADEYYGTLSGLEGRVSELPPPAGDQPDLGQFISGLRSAAEINDAITRNPPTGREAESGFADLTISSGNVQAGALGFGLGANCKAVATVIAQSANSLLRG